MISFCEKKIDGKIVEQGMIDATREALTSLAKSRKKKWIGAMEATCVDTVGIDADKIVCYVKYQEAKER